MNDNELMRYSRHLLLEGFDVAAQEQLLASTVLIVGAGGLGCPAAMYLCSAGVGNILIADGDIVELGNLQRQIGHGTSSLGMSKVFSLQATLQALNPDARIEAIAEYLDEETLQRQVPGVDVVLDCTDNFSIRYLVNKACVRYRKPLVSGAAIRAEGQLAVFDLRAADSPCYACVFPEVPGVQDENCSRNGILAPVVGVIGSLQALEAIRLLTGYGRSGHHRLRFMDFHQDEWRELRMQKDSMCRVCSHA